jgi:hypothetical protein
MLSPKSITRAHAMSEACAVSKNHISNALMKRCFVLKSYIAPVWRFVSFEKLSSRAPMGGFLSKHDTMDAMRDMSLRYKRKACGHRDFTPMPQRLSLFPK